MVVAVCDDDSRIVEKLTNILKRNGVEEVLSFSSGIQLLESIKGAYPFDLIFLDIEMPGINGLATAKSIRELSPGAVIVILTKYQQYALEAYSIKPFTYLVKPVSEKEIVAVLDDVRGRISQQSSFTFSYGYQSVTLPVNGIRYIESYDWILYLHYGTQVYKINDRLKNVSDKLGESGFLRVHRSYLVNISYIREVDRQAYRIQLASGEKIPVSKLKIKNVADAFFRERTGTYPW